MLEGVDAEISHSYVERSQYWNWHFHFGFELIERHGFYHCFRVSRCVAG